VLSKARSTCSAVRRSVIVTCAKPTNRLHITRSSKIRPASSAWSMSSIPCRDGAQSESYLLRSGRNDTPLWSSLGAIHQRIVEEHGDIGVQRALIAPEREGVIATLIDDLLGDRALTIERVDGHNGSLSRQELQQLRNDGDLVRLG